MATYKKKGYKKEKRSKNDLEYLSQESTTAEVFSSLDEGASKIEVFFEKNQKAIFILLFAIVAGVAGYMWYDSNVKTPREQEGVDNMVSAQTYFDKALTEADEKVANEDFDKAINGADGKYGFKQVADKYSGTKAGNLANYSLGMIYYKKGEFKNAVSYLSKFDGDDDVLQALAYGTVGDAFVELEQNKDALDYYKKALAVSDNAFTAPKFYLKAGKLALDMGDKAKANKYFKIVKDKYATSDEAKNIDQFIVLSK